MTPEEGRKLEPVVNSFPDVPDFERSWKNFKPKLEEALGRSFSEDEEDKVYSDIRDWWKNGNLGSDGFWAWGEWPWWTEEVN